MIVVVRNFLVISAFFLAGFVAGRIQPFQCKAYLEDGRRLMSYSETTCKYVHPRSYEAAMVIKK